MRNSRRMLWGNRASIAALLLLAFLAPECSAGSGAGTPDAAESDSSDSTPGMTVANFFPGTAAKPTPTVTGVQSDVNCPSLQIREGASTLTIGPGGDNTTMSLKYQGTFVRAARQCAVVGGNLVIKVGVQGRLIVGPAGGPGQVDVPLRVAVVQESPGNSRLIVTKLIRIPVTVGSGQGNVVFTHIEEGLSFPLPPSTAELDDYVVYVGFDPLAAEAPEKPKAKPKPKAKAT